MALVKQPVDVRFGEGLDQKKDPKQVVLGRFIRLINVVFDKGMRLTKRFGYANVTQLPADTDAAILSAFQDSLLTIGNLLQAYSASSKTWTEMGDLTPVSLEVSPVARPNASVTQCDSAVAASPLTGELGLACTTFTTAAGYFYQVTDASTGATIIPSCAIPTTATVNGAPKVFVVGRYFVIVFSATHAGTERLQFIAVSLTNPSSVTTAADITTTYTATATTAWDGVVANNSLYLAWNGSDMGGAVRVTYIDSTLTQHSTVAFATEDGSLFGLSADTSGSTPTIYVTYYQPFPALGRVLAVSSTLTTVLAPTTFSSADVLANLAPYAANGTVQIISEVTGHYTYDADLPNNHLKSVTLTSAGVITVASHTLLRGAGLASKAFALSTTEAPVVLALFSGLYENGYFFIDGTTSRVLCKLAVGNATFAADVDEGYLKTGLPGAWLVDTTHYLGYLQADLIQPVNKTQGASSTGVYLQTGASLAALTPGAIPATAEIGGTLLIAAGLLSMYDGSQVVEHGFNLWPDEIEGTTSSTGGNLDDQAYYYYVTYEWTDAQGYLHQSAPSVPLLLTTTGGNTSTNTVYAPTLRLTSKTGVRLGLYRWSTGQQVPYRCATLNNSTTTDFVTFTDTLADSSIVGNQILYTEGQVENIGAPPCNVLALYRSRVCLVDAEDQNSTWFSKTVGEGVPVEFFDGFTIFCAPTIGSQGPTGPITALGAMDDKLILFKRDGAYYETGQGPTAAGTLNDFQDPVYITSSVGCANPQSIVLMPSGLIFQSDKGRWLLGRDLSTRYIGAPVDDYNSFTDTSALTVPGTNQVRITTSGGPTLLYDYYYDQWTVTSLQLESSVIVGGVHTTLDRFGRVREEAPNTYVDGSDPVLMAFTTGWGSFAGLQGYQRAYMLLLEGQYFSPFTLSVGLAFDYDPVVKQQLTVTPPAPNLPFGGDPTFGASYVFGGANTGKFEPRIFLQQQQCEAFQVTVQEQYDRSYGYPPGQGLNLSGMTAVVGVKKGYRPQSAATSFG